MMRLLGPLLLSIFVAGLPAAAQDTVRWSDIDCARSRIAGPPGLKCRATQNFSGGQRGWAADAEGTFRNSMAYGERAGVTLFYYLAEATSMGSSVMEGASLQHEIRNEIRDGSLIKDFSPLGHRDGADYMVFTSPNGKSCVGMRRYGPSQGSGYQWILYGIRCDPGGRTISDADIDGLIASATCRSA